MVKFAPGTSNRLDNGEAFSRSLNLFLIGFVSLPSILLVVFIYVAHGQRSFSSDAVPLFSLALVWATIVAIGYCLTLRRTPKDFLSFPERQLLVIRPFLGRPWRVSIWDTGFLIVMESYGRSPISPEPCELVEFHSGGKERMRLVVVEGLLDGIVPRKGKASNRAGPPAPLGPSAEEGPGNGS